MTQPKWPSNQIWMDGWMDGRMDGWMDGKQQICKQTPRFTIGDCAGGHRSDNRDKNRDVLIVPRTLSHSFAFDFILLLIPSPPVAH